MFSQFKARGKPGIFHTPEKSSIFDRVIATTICSHLFAEEEKFNAMQICLFAFGNRRHPFFSCVRLNDPPGGRRFFIENKTAIKGTDLVRGGLL